MKGIEINEKTMLVNALEKGEIDTKKPSKTLGLLIKHYILEGYEKEEVYNIVDEFMEKNYEGYIRGKWEDFIYKMIETIMGLKRLNPIIDVDKVTVTKSEWDKIIELNDKRLEKVAFVLLVYKKVLDKKGNTHDYTVGNELMDILQEAVGNRKQENKVLFGELKKIGYIDNVKSCDGIGITINYCDYESGDKIIIEDFDKIIHYYNEVRFGWKYKKCENKECNKWFRVYSNNGKYCTSCAKKIKQEQINKIKREKRNKDEK